MRLRLVAAASCALLGSLCLHGDDGSSWERRIEGLVDGGQLDEAARLAGIAAGEPDSAAAGYGWLGRISMAGGRFEEALQHFNLARRLGARVVEIADPWATALERQGRTPEACALLNEASAAEEGSASLRYRTGACLLRLDAPREALPHLEAARRQGLTHAAASLKLAQAQFGIGREDLAVDLLTGMTEQGADPGTLLEIGKMLFRGVLYRHALAPLQKAWAARPGWYDAGMYLALARYQLEDYEECVQVLSSFPSEFLSSEARILLGSALARHGDTSVARQELEIAVRMAPRRADGYLNLGLFHLDQGMGEDARRAFAQAATRDAQGAKVLYRVGPGGNCRGLTPPRGLPGGDSRQALYFSQLADTLLAGQQWGSALAVYLEALRIDPRLSRPYGGIGLICQELGTAQVGLEFVKQGLRLHPADRELHYYLGSLYDHLSEPLRAIESYRTALGLGETRAAPARYWLRLGMAQIDAGQASRAEESFRTALAGEPGLAEAHYQLGRLRFGEGRYALAESLFERAVALDPSLAEAYYSWGLACVRTGKSDKGREILDSHRRKSALRKANADGLR